MAETKQQEQENTSNFLQLSWRNPKAVEAVDIFMNVFHLGSPTFLIKEESGDRPGFGFALWLKPLLNLVKDSNHKFLKRIEIRSSPSTGNSSIYLTLDLSPWVTNSSSAIKKFEKLQQQMFLNLILNLMDQEVTVVCECVAEGMALCALIQDFFLEKTSAEQISLLWQEMVDDILAENNNLITLCKHHSQKYLKTERFLKFLPLTFHFYGRLSNL